MLLPTSLKNSVRRTTAIRQFAGPRSPLRKPSFRPGVEALEDRTVPTAGSVLTIGGAGDDSAHDIAVDAAGNMYVTGRFANTVDFDPANSTPGDTLTSVGTSDVYVAKYQANGTFAWVTAMAQGLLPSGDNLSIAVDGSGLNVWVAGTFGGTRQFGSYTLSSAAGSSDGFVTRLDALSGNVGQALRFGSDLGDGATGIALGSDGSVHVTGYFAVNGSATIDFDPGATYPDNRDLLTGGTDAYILKLTSSGAFAWAQKIGSGCQFGNEVALDAAGNVYVCGRGGSAPGGSGPWLTVTKFNSSGTSQWLRTVRAIALSHGYGMAVDAVGNVYTTGYCNAIDLDPGTGTDMVEPGWFLSALDTYGNHRWGQNIGNTSDGDFFGITTDASGNVYVRGGGVSWGAGTGDFDPGPAAVVASSGHGPFLSKFDTAGNLVSFRDTGIPTPGDLIRSAGAIAVHEDPVTHAVDVYLAGAFSGTAKFDTGTQYESRTSNGGSDAVILHMTQDRGAILGRVLRDLQSQSEGTNPLAGATVYLDQNNNNQFDLGETSTVTGPLGEYSFSHLPAGTYTVRQVVPDGWSQTLLAPVTLTTGQFATGQDLLRSYPTQIVTFNSTNVPKTIPTQGTVSSTLSLTDIRSILDLNVKLSISHKNDGDLKVTLVGPDGTGVTLVNRRGGSGDNFTNTVFNDEAATSITTGTAPFSNSAGYRPEGLLSAFDGKPLNGTWTLVIEDLVKGTGGTLTGWSLTAIVDQTSSPLQAAGGAASSPSTQLLTASQAQRIFQEALSRWTSAGLSAAQSAVLQGLTFRVADLGGSLLAVLSGTTILIDDNAAGWGWFVDATPSDDSEFSTAGNQGEQGRIDLLTAIVRQVGSALGLDTGTSTASLSTGTRALPTAQQLALDPVVSASAYWDLLAAAIALDDGQRS